MEKNQQNQTSIDTSEGFYSKTPASRLANKEILKGKKLNVLTISKKLQKKDIEPNKVVEINTMKSESSKEDLTKEELPSIQNRLQQNVSSKSPYIQNKDTCQSALLKKSKTKKDDTENQKQDHSQSDSKSKIEYILPTKDLNLFKRLEQKAFKVMNTMDEKMIDALQRKEYEIVKSFQTIIKRLMDELSSLNEKLKNENLAMLRDSTINNLEKQVAFFRDQSYQLNNQIKDLEYEYKLVMQINNEKDEEINSLQKALINVKAKLINNSAILDQQQRSQSPMNLNKNTNSSLLITECNFQNEKIQKVNAQETSKKSQSPLRNNRNNDQLNYIQSGIKNEENDLYGQTNSEILRRQPQKTPNKANSIQQIKSQTKKGSPTSCQSVMVSEENTESNHKMQNFDQGTSQNLITPNFSIGGVLDASLYIDIEALVSVYIQDKESQQTIKHALINFISNKLRPKNQIIQNLQKQLNESKQSLAYFNQIQNGQNELEALFVAAVEDTKAQVLKRNNYQSGKFTSSDRIDIIYKFMSSEKFLQIVQAKIFNKKCCENQNCLFNINTVQKKANSLLKEYGTNEQIKNLYKGLKDLTIDEKINSIFDVSMERTGQNSPKSNFDQETQSLLQKWKIMNNISGKYKKENSKSAMNNSTFNDSKEYSSLLFDQNYLKELQKNQQKIYRMNNQFRRMFKEEKIQDKEIDERLTGFINETMHKLDFDDPKRKTSDSQPNNQFLNLNNTLTSTFSSKQQQIPQILNSTEKPRSHSIRVTYRHGKIYN
ncbi:hypothetical protein TTHERM_00462990 (macronuclear) [Tetrahymena thermophila SB210]|uniref:Uncharacterized protein n=1 Tax=Tetrahymena thermophila (strain SB210) TaxID=312017 RepID=Q23PY4_TETTS|nr:hypothetical protein TTHERM_00462990 [Tetrahymena thermophila SB210]EAR98551.1 hypothetical protein TTHERM_00462990 [Tetrahymena thermophila SB210]|eukprot:XP_001018796.1 hypothetical protein TTHERM_00462990 [Tetrahymena thermophila SB210]